MTFVTPPFAPSLLDRLHALNNAHAEELSYKTREEFVALIAGAHVALARDDGSALLVAFGNDSRYDNPNFRWLAARYRRFLYIDRVVVGEAARGQGLARNFYEVLASQARHENRERLVCEINQDPPNEASDRFHQALGFSPVGTQRLPGTDKTVRYWCKDLA